MICGVKPITLPNGELAEYLSILRSHNQVLEKHGNQSDLLMEKFRVEFLSGRLDIELSSKDQDAIKALTSEIKDKITAHHIKMIQGIALRYCRCFNVNGIDKLDIVEEGICALVKALYAYTNTTNFSTFSHWVVSNSLKDYFRETQNGMSPVSKRNVNLNNQVEAYRSSNENISFNRAVVELKLSDDEVRDAFDARCYVVPNSSIPISGEDDKLLLEAIHQDDSNDEIELAEAYRTCELSIFERIVMDAAINSWHGWMVDLGREYPSNGKPRTRQHIRMVLHRVRKKVQKRYKEMYSCEHEAAVA